MSKERYPETKPRKLTDEEKAQAEAQRIAAELEADRRLVGLPADVPVSMTEGQLARAEQEKLALLEAIAPVPQKAGPEAQDGKTQRQEPIRREFSAARVVVKPAAPRAVDPAAVAAKLEAATALVKEQQAKVEAGEEQDRLAKEARELELEAARQQLGLAQQAEDALTRQRTSQDLKARAALYEREGARNRVTASTSAEEIRQQFTREAGTLITPALEFLAAVEAFLEEHKDALTKISKTTWENAPGEWQVIHRVQLAEAAARPAATLLSDLHDAHVGGVNLIRHVDAVIAGRAEPSAHLLERLRQVSLSTMQNYQSRLGVLNTSLRRIEERALKHVRPGVRPDVELRVTPYSPPAPVGQISTGYDVLGRTQQ